MNILWQPVGLGPAIAEALRHIPSIPPCAGAVITASHAGWGCYEGRICFIDTVVWRCPDGQTITKQGPTIITDQPCGPALDERTYSMHAPTPYRFAQTVSPLAPKPGHHLTTASFQLNDESHLLWVIEGQENDALTFVGLATDFNGTRSYRFKIRGPLVEGLQDLPYSPYDRGTRVAFTLKNAPINLTGATVVYSHLRAPNGLDPDAAIARFEQKKGAAIVVTFADMERGFLPVLILIGVGLALACGGCSTPQPGPGANVTVTETTKIGGKIGVGFPEYGLGAEVSGSYEKTTTASGTVAPVGSAGVAPVGSGGIAPPSSGTSTGHP